MMEQPTNSKSDNMVEENKTIAPVKDPAPIQSPNPDHMPDSDGALKHGDVVAINIPHSPVDVHSNDNFSAAEENNKSLAEAGMLASLKSKKSVRWSEELVMEQPIPRNFDHGSTNPYVNYTPAASDDPPSSFNLKETMGSMKDVLGR